MFAPAVSPSPPTSPLVRSLMMSPNMFVVTMTSNRSGRMTSCMQVLSTISSRNLMSG
jgi:hypothetical protein